MRRLYSTILYVIAPVVLLRLLWRSRLNPGYRNRIRERFAYFRPLPRRPRLWMHAVSVGEVIAAAPLIRHLLETYPDRALLVTTTTPTGSLQLRSLFGETVEHVYLPYDLPHVVTRFLSRTRPELALFMETELWPNLYEACASSEIPLLVLNARLSARSMRRYLWVKRLLSQVLSNVTLIAAQDVESAQRFEVLGGRDVRVLGNLKYDLEISPDVLKSGKQFREAFGASRQVWIAASTHAGETPMVLAAFRRVRERHPGALLILVPRHPEHFLEAGKACTAAGYRVAYRSRQECGNALTDVLLGDSLGELLTLYASSDVAFVGGSLVPSGGHNPLEAAAIGLPVVTGPYIENFSSVYQSLMGSGAADMVETPENLGTLVADLLADSSLSNQKGEAGLAVVSGNRGAMTRTAQLIGQILKQAGREGNCSV